jgi:hypothetical protein
MLQGEITLTEVCIQNFKHMDQGLDGRRKSRIYKKLIKYIQ